MNDFFANLYEFPTYLDQFSQDMYNENLYLTIGLLLLSTSLVWMVIYYYIIGAFSSKFNKLWHWLLWGLLGVGLNFGLAYLVATDGLDALYFATTGDIAPYYNEFYVFSAINAMYAALLVLLWSALIKWWSPNNRRTPF